MPGFVVDGINIGQEIERCLTAGALTHEHRCPVVKSVGTGEKVGANLRQHPHVARLFLLRNELARTYLANQHKQELADEMTFLGGCIISLGQLIDSLIYSITGVFDRVHEVRADWQVVVTNKPIVFGQELLLIHIKVFE